MNELFEKLREQITRAWELLNVQQKVMLITVPVLLLVMMGVAVYFVSQPDYVELITTEDRATLNQIITYLEENGYAGQYQVLSDTEIQIDSRIEPQVTIALAGQGLLGYQAGVGFELFDNLQLGMTDRMFELQELRALQNVLASYIVSGSQKIREARVIINNGRESLFTSQAIPPSASVKIVARGSFPPEEVTGIQMFVAASIPGLDPRSVRVVDRNNKLLSEEDSAEPGVAEASKQAEIQRIYEAEIEQDLGQVLQRIVGPNNYTVIANVDLDFEKSQSEIYDIESQDASPISEKTYTEESTQRGIAGPPGTVPNVQDTGIGASADETGTTIEETLTNYQYPWSKTLQEKELGEPEKIFVSVTINQGVDINGELVARTPETMQTIQQQLRVASGMPEIPDPAATEQLVFSLAEMPFDTTLEDELASEEFWDTVASGIQTMLPLILLVSVGFLAYLFFQRAFAPEEIEVEEEEEVPIEPVTEAKELTLSQLGLAEFGDIASLPAEEQRRLKMQEHVINYAQEKPEEVAAIIRAWLSA